LMECGYATVAFDHMESHDAIRSQVKYRSLAPSPLFWRAVDM